jgi:hypothetical protein
MVAADIGHPHPHPCHLEFIACNSPEPARITLLSRAYIKSQVPITLVIFRNPPFCMTLCSQRFTQLDGEEKYEIRKTIPFQESAYYLLP